MSDALLIDYIKGMLAVGHSVEQIKEGVREKGGDPALVDAVIANRAQATSTVQQAIAEARGDIDEIQRYIDARQSIMKGTMAASLVAVVCAVLWVLVAIGTERIIAYLACAMGWAIGITMRRFGNGFGVRFRIHAVLIAIAALFMANAVMVIIIFSKHLEIPLGEAIKALATREFYLFVLLIHDLFMYVCYLAAILCAWWFSAYRLDDEKLVEYALLVKAERKR